MAGRFSVEAVFKAVDRVTAPVSRMQNRVGKFTRAMSRGLRGANRALNKVVGGFKQGGLVIAGGITVATLAINKMADSADALAKRARRLEFPIEELQQWQFVAEQSGLSTAEFDKSLEKFTKSVGEARSGTGTLVTILKKANPELLKQITSADNAAEAFDLYMKGLRGTKNQLDKTALSTAAFGRTGAKFLNITEQSEKAIAALRKEQIENGIITKKQAEAAEAYNDAANSLKRSLGGLLQNVILPMLPAITSTLRVWREWIVSNKELIKVNVMEFLISVKNFFSFLVKHGSTIAKIIAGIVALSLAIKVVTIAMAAFNLIAAANPLTLILLAIVAAAGLVMLAWEPISEFFTGLWKRITDIAGAAGSFFGFGDDDDKKQTEPQIVSPQDRVARVIEEQRKTSTAEVTIRDESGRAAVTGGKLGTGITLQPSGAF